VKTASSGHGNRRLEARRRYLSLLLALTPVPWISAGETTALISMKAQHAEHDHWEQWNPGLSIEHRESLRSPLDVSFTAGGVRDSIGNWSPHAAFGLHKQYGEWSFGLNATLLYRQEDLQGNKVGLKFAPLPSLDYTGENFGIGLVFIPQPTDSPQDSAALLMQLRMPL